MAGIYAARQTRDKKATRKAGERIRLGLEQQQQPDIHQGEEKRGQPLVNTIGKMYDGTDIL